MKKKILSTVLVLSMAVAMTACGSKDKGGSKVTVTADEVQDKMMEAVKGVDSAEVAIDAALGLSMDAEGTKVEMDLGFDADGEFTIGTPGGHVNLSFDMKTSGTGDDMEQKMTAEAYVVTDGDKATAYFNSDNAGWEKSEGTLDEIKASFEEGLSEYGMSIDDLFAAAESEDEQFKPTLSEKTVSVDKKECYELVYALDKDALMNAEAAADYAEYAEAIDTLDGNLKLYVETDTNLPVKMVFDLDLDINIMGMVLTVDEFDITVTADYNNVKEIKVPSEVTDNAVATE